MDRAEQYAARFDARQRERVRALITDELIAEHAADPLGERSRHSPELERVLNYFRRAPQAGKYAVVTVEPWREYRLGVLPGVRGRSPRVLDEPVFESEEAALHGVFLARVRELMGEEGPPATAGDEDRWKRAAIHGYFDVPSVAPGDSARLHVSCEEAGTYRLDVVRVINGDTHPDGPGFRSEPFPSPIDGEYEGRFQAIDAGSHVVVEDGGRLHATGGLTLHAFAMPTAPGPGRQSLLARSGPEGGYALALDESGHLTFALDGATITAPEPVLPWVWYAVSATWDRERGELRLSQRPVVNAVNGRLGPVARVGEPWSGTAPADVEPIDPSAPFVIAGRPDGDVVREHFNGKLDSPRVYGRALPPAALEALDRGEEPDGDGPLARWSFAEDVASDRVTDLAGDLHGRCVNQPARGMTGWNWRGLDEHFRLAPEQYGAIHFHDSDLDDARWEPDVELTVPDDMPSGVYAVRLRQGEAETHVPFFVRPPRGTAHAPVLVLVPTASYLAYANDRISLEADVSQAVVAHTPVLNDEHLFMSARPEYGLSMYDAHNDGSGVAYSSWRRPIISMRPDYRHGTGSVWCLPADLHLIDWLEASGIAYDVATDHDLHEEGKALLERYEVVLTGSHPEYYSTAMLDGLEDYLAAGGRLMYLGGNGFYWVVSFHPEKPWVMEVRRGEGGCRAWQARPGEYHHSTSGERGGLWRNRARPPQKIVGVGFASEGFDGSSAFVGMPDAGDPEAEFIFRGVQDTARFGDYGVVGGGAAGYEVDRYDLSLGTPPDALVVASSEEHSDNYPLVSEEIMFPFPGMAGSQDPRVRADIVYFRTPGGGEVFSTGSISWCGSLSANGYDNDVSRITRNVLERFAGLDGSVSDQ